MYVTCPLPQLDSNKAGDMRQDSGRRGTWLAEVRSPPRSLPLCSVVKRLSFPDLGRNVCYISSPGTLERARGAIVVEHGPFWVHWRQAGAAKVHFWRSPAPANAERTQIGHFGCFWTDLGPAGAGIAKRGPPRADLVYKARRSLEAAPAACRQPWPAAAPAPPCVHTSPQRSPSAARAAARPLSPPHPRCAAICRHEEHQRPNARCLTCSCRTRT
jgi:hypothetical protein